MSSSCVSSTFLASYVIESGSISTGVALGYFLFQSVFYYWYINCRGMWKEGNVLFNDAVNTFYLRLGLYGVGFMVKNHFRLREKKPAAATWATHSD